MFGMQKRLMLKYHLIEATNGSSVISGPDQGNLDDRKVQLRLHELFGYMTREMAEAMAELKNKPWRETLQETDREAFVEEVGDVFHFFLEFCITAGITSQELTQSFLKTNQKNVERQQNGY
ncbi:hypothetical protein ACWIG4_30375 [Streptomyces sp. NPDC002248]